MHYEQSVVILKDKSFIQNQAYRYELRRAFSGYCTSNENNSLANPQELDPKYVAIRTSRNLEVNVVLSVYDKKKYIKTKSFGCKYQNGSFESHKTGWLTSKTPRYVVFQDKDYMIEDKDNLVYKNIPWDTNNEYRLILEESKQSVILGLYSADEYELNRVLFNLIHAKIDSQYSKPEFKPAFQSLKYLAPSVYRARTAQSFLEHMLEVAEMSDRFKEEPNIGYDSLVQDIDNLIPANNIKISQMPKMKFETIDSRFDLSQFDQYSSMNMDGPVKTDQTELQGQSAMIKRQDHQHQSKMDRSHANTSNSMMIKSILKHPDQGGSSISGLACENVSQVKSKSVKIMEESKLKSDYSRLPQALSSISKISEAPRQPVQISHLVSRTSKSVIGKSEIEPEMSQVIAVHLQNNYTDDKATERTVSEVTKVETSKIVSPTSHSSSPLSNSPSKSPTRASPLARRQIEKSTKYFKKTGLDLYTTHLRESEVNSGFKSQIKKDYFGNDTSSLSKISTLGDNKLANANHQFHDKHRIEQLGSIVQEEFVFSSIQLPLEIDASNIAVQVYSFGIYFGSKDQKNEENLEIQKILMKSMVLKDRSMNQRSDTNRTLVELDERIIFENGFSDFVEIVVLNKANQDVVGSILLNHELFVQMSICELAYSVPIVSKDALLMLNLAPVNISNNRDRKIKACCDSTSRYIESLLKNRDLPKQLDNLIMVAIKQRKTDNLDSIMRMYLPPNAYLCIWLLISKKFKPKELLEGKEQENLVKFKSSIMQSLYVTKRESSSLELNNRVSLHFHKLLRDLERRAELANTNLNFSFGTIMDQVKGEYFKSSVNKFKIIDFIFSRIMCDYFNMFINDKMGSKNVLFTHHFRSCSRDYMLFHNYINLYCENIVKVAHLSARDLVIWILDHILSVNIGILREPLGYYHLNFLFLMSIKHKDDPTNSCGWRINLYLHVFILNELEKLLSQRLNCYVEVNYTLEYLYQLVVGEDSFYPRFRSAYMDLEINIPKIASQSGSALQSFFKSVSSDSSVPAMEKAEALYQKINANQELRKIFEENVLENVLVYQISRLSQKPYKLINLVKLDKSETVRKVALKVHKVYNKDWIEDDLFFIIVCDQKEHKPKDGGLFTISTNSSYSPSLELQLHKVGDELLYKDNKSKVGSTSIQLRRHKSNVIHKLLVSIMNESTGKQYYVSVSVLVLEVAKAKDELKFNEHNEHFKSLGSLNFLLMGGFKHPVSNFENLIMQKISSMYDELAMDVEDSLFNSKYFASMISGHQIQANIQTGGLDQKALKLTEKQLNQPMDTFLLTLKVLLFKKNFEMLEDYVIRYFGSDVNSLSAAETVYLLQALLKVIDIRWHLLEVVSYLERILKKPLGPKLDSFSLFLGVDPSGGIKSSSATHIDLRRSISELLTFMSFKKNSGSLPFGDAHNLFLIKDIVQKMNLGKRVTDNNFLSIRYSIGDSIISETIKFDRQFKTIKQLEVDEQRVELDEVMDSHRYMVDTSPLDFIRITKTDLRKIFTHLPLVEYLRFVTQSIRN